MKRLKVIIFLCIPIWFSCQNNSPATHETKFVKPAEFETQREFWTAWPHDDHARGYSNTEVLLEMIMAVAPFQKVVLIVPNDSIKNHCYELFYELDIESDSLDLIEFPYEEFWVRDMGPVFVKDQHGMEALLDFGFNAWGYTPEGHQDDVLDRRIANMLKLPVYQPGLTTESGNHEVNGKGTLILTKAVEMNRNPGISIKEIENIYKKYLGANNIIWIEHGLLEDRHSFEGPLPLGKGDSAYTVLTTGGHIDEFVRFVNDSTLMLAWPYEDTVCYIQRENAVRLEAAYQILKHSQLEDGRPIQIIKVPLPPLIIIKMSPGDYVYDELRKLNYENGHVFPDGKSIKVIGAASYLNFVITNQVVLVPVYGNDDSPPSWHEKDQQVMEIFKSVFPGKLIIPINSLAVNLGGGGMHCITTYRPL
ncbi:MAG: agmatine deiminase family protein [Cyclobacteriaceae bacterium]|nr:agmatine deiminase family protein [Cyclobacteriaceae bacterium]